jgi:alginate O-acetyltransferase complex protein AlgI
MSLTEPAFLFLFLPLFLALFQLGGRIGGTRGALTVLLAVSLFVSATQGRWFLLLTLVSSIVNFALLLAILRSHRASGKPGAYLRIGVLLNILVLILFKYAVWLQWIPLVGPLSLGLSAIIPITLSFLTFQRAVALLDAFGQPAVVAPGLFEPRPGEDARPRTDGTLRFLTFATMFPNLLIGPIAYITEILPQFRRRSFGRIRLLDIQVGLTLLVIGLFKKVFIADDLARLVVDPVYGNLGSDHPVQPLIALSALLGYFAQLYFDFSGYSDMAIGIARMFGIRLPINFKSPLRAVGIIDFYRRWHITLTRVIARFLFTPLSIAGTRFAMRRKLKGVRSKALSLWGPLLLNFLVIGLWHSASVTFVFFGLAHGIWYVVETEMRSSRRWKKFAKSSPGWFRGLTGGAITTLLIIVSFALARAPSLHVFSALLGSLDGSWTSTGTDLGSWIGIVRRLAIALAIIYFAPNAYEMLERYRPGISTWTVASTTLPIFRLRWRPTLLWGAFAAALGLIVFSRLAAPVPFVYGLY